MEEDQEMEKWHDNRNIYRRGADDGFYMGLYFTAIFALIVVSVSHPDLNIVALLLMLGVPALTFLFLRRTHVAAHGLTSFSALWMQGIVMFGCGCLIFSLLAFIYLRWVDTGFVASMVRMAIDLYSNPAVPDGQEMASTLQSLIDRHLLPTPLQLVLGWLWLGMFTGSLLSLLTAVAVRLLPVPPSNH